MKKLLFFLAVSTAVILMSGCSETGGAVETALSAEEHFARAQEYREEPEHLALAIWHYEQFLKSASGVKNNDTALAEIQLAASRELYCRQIAEEDLDTDTEIRDLQLKLRNLEQRNADLQSWISRLHTENRALREAHIGKVSRTR